MDGKNASGRKKLNIKSEGGRKAGSRVRIYTPRGIRRTYADKTGGPFIYSNRVSGNFYRWHNPQYLDCEHFWKSFLDGDFKWKATERFAGAYYNCGHYFARTEEAARAEAGFYMNDFEKSRVLLEVKTTFDVILDLTNEHNIWGILEMVGLEFERADWYLIANQLQVLLDVQQAGNEVADEIGCWAWERGYHGIQFISTRALTPKYRRLINDCTDHDTWYGIDGIKEEYSEMLRDQSIHNLVLLSGAAVVSGISSFRVNGGRWHKNPHYGFTPKQMDRVLKANGCEFDSDYQEYMSHVGIDIPGPTIIRLGNRGYMRSLKRGRT